MALATATITVYPFPKGTDNTMRRRVITGSIAISTGGTYPPGGFPLTWNFESIQAIPPGAQTPTSTGTPFPIDMVIHSVANPPSGYIYLWDNVVGNLHIFESANQASGNSGPLLEVGGAIDNHIVTDVIQFTAWFARE